MNQQEKLNALEEMMELNPGTLNPECVLSEIEEWDSLSLLSFLVLLDEKFGKSVNGNEIRNKKTVADLLVLME